MTSIFYGLNLPSCGVGVHADPMSEALWRACSYRVSHVKSDTRLLPKYLEIQTEERCDDSLFLGAYSAAEQLIGKMFRRVSAEAAV